MWQHLTVTEIACKLVFWNSKMLFTSSHPEITLPPNLTKSPSNPTPSNPNQTYSNSTATQLVHCTKLFHLRCHIFSFPLLEHRLSHKFPQTISTDKWLDQYFSRIGFFVENNIWTISRSENQCNMWTLEGIMLQLSSKIKSDGNCCIFLEKNIYKYSW